MKTTNPNIYTVCPNVGVLHPGEKTQLKIEVISFFFSFFDFIPFDNQIII